MRPLAADPRLWLAAEVTRDLVEVESLPAISLPDPYIASLLTPDGDRPLVEVREVTKQYKIGAGWPACCAANAPRPCTPSTTSPSPSSGARAWGWRVNPAAAKLRRASCWFICWRPPPARFCSTARNVAGLTKEEMKQFRRRAQFMFQNPFEALSPRFSLYRSLSDPLLIHGWKDESARRKRILETLDHVNLHPAEFFLDKYPHQLSGGQAPARRAGALIGPASGLPGCRRTGLHAGRLGAGGHPEHHAGPGPGDGAGHHLHLPRPFAAPVHLRPHRRHVLGPKSSRLARRSRSS